MPTSIMRHAGRAPELKRLKLKIKESPYRPPSEHSSYLFKTKMLTDILATYPTIIQSTLNRDTWGTGLRPRYALKLKVPRNALEVVTKYINEHQLDTPGRASTWAQFDLLILLMWPIVQSKASGN